MNAIITARLTPEQRALRERVAPTFAVDPEPLSEPVADREGEESETA